MKKIKRSNRFHLFMNIIARDPYVKMLDYFD